VAVRGAVICTALTAALVAVVIGHRGHPPAGPGGDPVGGTAAEQPRVVPGTLATGGPAPAAGQAVCGRPILRSRWGYDGEPGTFRTSGTHPGLPTFGAAGTDFPTAGSITVVPAGDNTAAAQAGRYQVNHAVVYFEPGVHTIRGVMYTGHDSAYVGGYTAAAGKAVLDGVDGGTGGTGKGGSFLASSTPSSGNNVSDTWEYLTIENYSASRDNAVMGNVNGGGSDNGDVYRFNTIGPNEFGYSGAGTAPRSGESSGGGYAIDAGSDTTIEGNCLTRNAQGAFNASDAVNLNIRHNEISRNGLGEYPDTAGGPGASPFACGCSGGGKILSSLNTNFVRNYVHDNYNVGIWFDFDNAGASISHNFIASNWGQGIMYEASYNAHITANTLVGNGWASHGQWPAGVGGKACFNGVSCAGGYGPVTGAGGGNPYGAVDLSNSGGSSALTTVPVPAGQGIRRCGSGCTMKARYSGQLLVTGNVLRDNFGGVKVYTDTNRYPGNIDNDSACGPPLGVLGQVSNATYYQQNRVLTTDADTTVSGDSVTSAGGTRTLCANYGQPGGSGGEVGASARAPAVGMGVYNLNSGAFVGTVASVRDAKAFTLSKPAGRLSGASLLLSAFGGCGPADYFGGRLGATSGRPPARYLDNCIWGSRNVTVTGNLFSASAGVITGCSTGKNLCGYMVAVGFDAGVPPLMQFFDGYPRLIASATGGLGNVWARNSYVWSGPGGWQFQAGLQGHGISRAQWQHAPYGQDAGSTFS
jgi:hypothetical protein